MADRAASGKNDVQLDVLAIGLTTLDIAIHPYTETPPIDQGVLSQTIALSPAGTAGGFALVAARLGLSVALASTVGDDVQGRLLQAEFERVGVDLSALGVNPDVPTSTTVLSVREGGQRSTMHMLGASVLTPLGPEAWSVAARSRAVHWGGVGYPGLAGQGADLLGAAKASGAFVTCDLISPQASAKDELTRLLPFVDLFMPSLAEVVILAGTDDLRIAADYFMSLGAGACLFKLGAQGAAMFTKSNEISVPAFAIDPVDTTSCGDSFCAGFHAARKHGHDAKGCLEFATATAASVARGVGTLGALEDYDHTSAWAETQDVAR